MAKKEYEESIGEMKHADKLMERLFTLDALPNLQDLGKLNDRRDAARSAGLRFEVGARRTADRE